MGTCNNKLFHSIYKKAIPAPGEHSIKSTFQGGTSIKFGRPYKSINNISHSVY